MADKVYCIRKTLRLRPEEAELLAEKSKAAQMNEAEYLRFLISQRPNDYPEIRAMMKQLINEVNRIGVNINEVVHNNNSELYLPSDKQHLIAYMKKLNQVMQAVEKKLG
jgi:hypothetical protein